MSILVLYLMFIIVTLVVISYLVTKMEVQRPLVVIAALGALIISPIMLSYIYSTYIMPVREIIVPNVSLFPYEEARIKLERAGLTARIAERSYEKTVPEGMVISQRPEAGRTVKLGRAINLKVSIGERMVTVPNLVGRSLSQIEVVLSEVGLRIGTKKVEYSDQYESGSIISQSPMPDDEVAIGSLVDVTVSENPNFGTVKAPNLVSKTLDEAKSMLSSLRLNAIVFYHETKQFKSGTVLSQDPIEGEEMKAGGAIKIFISITPTGESKGTQKSKENE